MAMVSSRGQGTLSSGWEFKLQYHLAARIILQKTREMHRDPLCSNFLLTKDHQKSKRVPENIYFCIIDYAKAFDCVDYNTLWKF